MPARNKTSHAEPIVGFVLLACLIMVPETCGKGWSKEAITLGGRGSDQGILKQTRHTFVCGPRWDAHVSAEGAAR